MGQTVGCVALCLRVIRICFSMSLRVVAAAGLACCYSLSPRSSRTKNSKYQKLQPAGTAKAASGVQGASPQIATRQQQQQLQKLLSLQQPELVKLAGPFSSLLLFRPLLLLLLQLMVLLLLLAAQLKDRREAPTPPAAARCRSKQKPELQHNGEQNRHALEIKEPFATVYPYNVAGDPPPNRG